MNLQFTLSRTWLWLITLAVALIITGVIAFCWIYEIQTVRDSQRYQADTQRYDHSPLVGGDALLLDRRTGKTLFNYPKGKIVFPKQTEE
jgi:hypothetical protein